jgi:hypothetical protein
MNIYRIFWLIIHLFTIYFESVKKFNGYTNKKLVFL